VLKLDALLAVALAVALQLRLALGDDSGHALVNIAGGLLLTLPLAARRRAPVAVAGVYTATAALSTILGGGLFAGEPPPFAPLAAGAITFYSLGAYAEERPALIGAAAGVAGLWVTVLTGSDIDLQSFLFSGGLIVLTPWLAGRTVRARAQRMAERERLAAQEERARIARELHDIVAHSVGAMVAQAQGGRRVIERDPERAKAALETIERTGRSALDEMRRALGVLRAEDAPREPQPGMDDLPSLVAQARRNGLPVEFVTEGEPAPLPAGADLSAYRIVQEALTNTLKHAGPVPTRVAVRYGSGELELVIADDGASVKGPAAAGHGLVGMRERVALFGGDLQTGQRPEGGFTVRASLPLAP
jgi:signal transduction histidine kinase